MKPLTLKTKIGPVQCVKLKDPYKNKYTAQNT